MHTAGPWSVNGDLVVGAPEARMNPKVEPYPHAVCKLCWDFDGDCNANGDLPWEVAKDNASLIAAAPDLLAACKIILARLDLEPVDAIFPCSALRDTVRAAVALAEGTAR